MYKAIAPIPIPHRPWALNGISKEMMVSHYENNYGGAVRTLNAVRKELASLEGGAPGYRIRGLKREELSALNSVALHELYFGNLGGDGRIIDPARAMLEEHFGSYAAWRREFVAVAQSLAGGSGWALLTYSRRQKALWHQTASDHTQAAVDATPVLALDMYEHAYHMDFGANASAYIDAIMRNLDWAAVAERMAAVRADRPLPAEDPSDKSLPSISVEELTAQLAQGEPVQLLDARPRHYIARASDIMAGAVWRDPERVDEWIGELKPDEPVAVYCAYGFHVGCGVTKVLRERGLDARYVRGGLSAWYAAGGARAARLPGEGA
ncbi:MAG TPA: Fe-Mn family superoxide dismutase [Methylomirabilota bacterium]|nr:Fe-Mn family superoxide dismutase [Methylomirabilota bacterium]